MGKTIILSPNPKDVPVILLKGSIESLPDFPVASFSDEQCLLAAKALGFGDQVLKSLEEGISQVFFTAIHPTHFVALTVSTEEGDAGFSLFGLPHKWAFERKFEAINQIISPSGVQIPREKLLELISLGRMRSFHL